MDLELSRLNLNWKKNMKKRNLLIPILAGLVVGQIFAEGERPFSLVNTIRVGYDDNVFQNDSGETSAYVSDIIDLAFRAALTDRTDLMFKAQFELRSDKEVALYPNLYAVLTHSASSRLLLQLSEYFKSGDSTSGDSSSGRQKYWMNIVKFTPTYVLTPKDRLELFLSYTVMDYEKKISLQNYDTIEGGISWQRELIPQRTRSSVNLRHRRTEYTKRNSAYSATDLTGELGHTLNQNWSVSVEVGGTYIEQDLGGGGQDEAYSKPFFKAGVAYEPSPRTRLTSDYIYQYAESENSSYLGQTSSEVRLGAQHDFTGKIMGRATLRYLDSEYEAKDNEVGGGAADEQMLEFDIRFHYKLNRINFLELGYKYRDKSYDNGVNDWDQNMIDMGWRVEL